MSWVNRLSIFAFLVIIAVMSVRTCRKKEAVITSIPQLQQIKNDSAKYWRDEAGREHALRQVAVGDLRAVKVVYQTEMDSIRKVLKVKEKQIAGFISASTEVTGKVVPQVETVYYPDTTHAHMLRYDDRFLTLRGVIGDSSYISYQVRDSLTFAVYHKSAGLFRKATFVDAFSQNPDSHIKGITAVQIKYPRPGRIGIGPYAGYGFDGRRWSSSVGVSIHYSLIRF